MYQLVIASGLMTDRVVPQSLVPQVVGNHWNDGIKIRTRYTLVHMLYIRIISYYIVLYYCVYIIIFYLCIYICIYIILYRYLFRAYGHAPNEPQ